MCVPVRPWAYFLSLAGWLAPPRRLAGQPDHQGDWLTGWTDKTAKETGWRWPASSAKETGRWAGAANETGWQSKAEEETGWSDSAAEETGWPAGFMVDQCNNQQPHKYQNWI